jgi:hypothetical protein
MLEVLIIYLIWLAIGAHWYLKKQRNTPTQKIYVIDTITEVEEEV